MTLSVVSGTVLAEEAGEGFVKEESDRQWHFRVGPVISPRVRAKINAPRRVMPVLPTPGTTAGNGTPQAADPSAGYVGRDYVDGFVRPDQGTDDPDSIVSGLTWNWGADDVAAQYSGGRMEFHTEMSRWTETVSTSASDGGSSTESDQDTLLGVEAVGGWMFFENDTFDATLDAGFRFYGTGDLTAESKYGASVTTTRNEYRFVDSYDASGWTTVPSGPHLGTPGGPGRVIGATPTRREELMGTSTRTDTYTWRSSTKLDYRIWDLRFGPTFGWRALDRLTIRGGVYGLLGLVDAKLRTTGNTWPGAENAKKTKCSAVFGMAFGLSAQFYLTESIFLLGCAEYDWWTDKVRLDAGGAGARIELSDFTVSVGLGFDF